MKERASAAAAPQPTGSIGIDRQFVFLDVETTGLDPYKDRVLEIGIVVTDSRGKPLDEWSTLINPGPGVAAGATHVHGIKTEWLAAAPTFSSVTHEIARRVHGRIVVAHNSRFDCDFLDQEFTRAGYPSSAEWPTICTLDLADKLCMPKRLPSLCAQLGVPHTTHDALGDARACAHVLHRFLGIIHPGTLAGVTGAAMRAVPREGPPVRRVYRNEAKAATQVRPVLGELIDSLPPYDSTGDRDSAASSAYLVALEDAVADGYVSPDEIHALTRLAHRMELAAEEVRDLHRDLILKLIDTALQDRKISKTERDEIERVATWLGVDLSDWDAMVKAARARAKSAVAEFKVEIAGKKVVFTGSGVHTSSIREALASKHGFGYARIASDRSTDLLVIGTAKTDTSQVSKAREAGIPIMVEAEFWRRLGEL